jgi:hypothetical protein
MNKIKITGDMIALYIDSNVTITGYDFTPGPQVNPPAFAITGPGGHITINNFRSSGQGGIIANKGQFVTGNPNFIVETVTIRDYALTGGPSACGGSACHLDAGDVHNLTVAPSGPSGFCDFGTGGLRVAPQVKASNVTIDSCSIGETAIGAASGASVSKLFYNGDTFILQSPTNWAFSDPTKNATTISIKGGTYLNCPSSNLTNPNNKLHFKISGLANFPC